MNLLALQRAFCDALLDESAAPLAAIAGPEGHARFGVYRHTYRAQLIAALRDTFEKTWSWLGDDAFEAVAGAYVKGHPPVSRSLNDYGDAFAGFVASTLPDDPHACELAWLDWAVRRAFDGADAEPLKIERLQTLDADDWGRATFLLHPTLGLGRAATNAVALWSAIDANRAPPSPERLDIPASLRVWRQGLSPRYRTIAVEEARALTMILEGRPFASVCEGLAAHADPAEAIETAGAMLAEWLADGLIVGLGRRDPGRSGSAPVIA